MSATSTSFCEHLSIIEANSSQNPAYMLACIIDLTAQMLDAAIENAGLARNADFIGRTSFSQKIGALAAGQDQRLIDLADSFRSHKNAIPPLSAGAEDILELLADARAIMRHLNYKDRMAQLRVAQQPRTVNAVSVETPRGYKTFLLMQGDVTVIKADLLVISTHAPEGMVVRSLEMNYGVTIDHHRRWLQFDERAWTCFQSTPNTSRAPFPHILTVRMPSYHGDRSPSQFFDNSIRGMYASIAALEQMEYSFPVVSMPVLYGQRILDYPAAVESLIRHAVAWLKKSDHTHTIQFVVYNGNELRDWDKAMNTCLGHTLVSTGHNAVLESLRHEVSHHAKQYRNGPLNGAIRPLLEALSRQEDLCIENICVFGRKLVEIMLDVLLPRLGLTSGPQLMQNIETLRQSSRIAPWIISYMHSLRIFGNETVHVRPEDVGYCPANLAPGDLVSALSAIRSLLVFWDEMEKELNHVI